MKLTPLLVIFTALGAAPMFAQTHSQTQDKAAAAEHDRRLDLTALLGAPLLPLPIPQDAPAAKSARTKSSPSSPTSHTAQVQESDGQRIFEQNCSRCHNAPEGFSPSIAGTIVRHMRVRASLSQEEEKELMQFFNP